MSYPRLYKTFHLCFSLLFVASFMKKNPIKFYGVLAHFSRTYEVVKFWMIELYLDVSDAYMRMHIKNILIVAYM